VDLFQDKKSLFGFRTAGHFPEKVDVAQRRRRRDVQAATQWASSPAAPRACDWACLLRAEGQDASIMDAALQDVSLDPSPVIEAYKRDVDRTLIRENLRLSPDERVRKMISVLRFVEEVRTSNRPGT
jgi:hypothetical protein